MTTIHRLNERAQEAFRRGLATALRTGRWDPIEADEYLSREEDLRWEQSRLELDAVTDAMTEAEARYAWGDR